MEAQIIGIEQPLPCKPVLPSAVSIFTYTECIRCVCDLKNENKMTFLQLYVKMKNGNKIYFLKPERPLIC